MIQGKDPMKRCSTVFLQMGIVFIALGALIFLLREPHFEGRNAHATLFQTYFRDPFLIYVYVASTPFFVLLYWAYKLLGLVRRGKASSGDVTKGMRNIKFNALMLIGFVAIGEVFIFLNDSDDRAGGVFMGLLFTFVFMATAITATWFERKWRNAADPFGCGDSN